jgi:hypothetical protein
MTAVGKYYCKSLKDRYIHFSTFYCLLMFHDVFLDAGWNAVVPGAMKYYSEIASTAAVGRILEKWWTVYKASEKYRVLYNTSKESILLEL